MKIETRDYAPHVVRTGWTEGKNRVAMVVHFGLHHIKGNSAPYFSITADGYENGRESFGGCCHDIIAEHLPDLKDVIALHLSDIDGAPMHAEANAWYWLAGVVDVGEKYHGGSGDYGKNANECLRIFCEHVRIGEREAVRIIGRFNKQARAEGREAARRDFGGWIDGQRPRWKREADELIRKYGLGVYGHDRKTPAELLTTIGEPA